MNEDQAIDAVGNLFDSLEAIVSEHSLWRLGDGHGGWLQAKLDAAFPPEKYPRPPLPSGRVRTKNLVASGARICAWCGSVDDLHCDHIVPVSRGGCDEDYNLRWLCRSCNLFKGARLDKEVTPDEFNQWVKRKS